MEVPMNHDTYVWYRRDPFLSHDIDEVGGDHQVGPAHSVSWQRITDKVLSTYETVTVYWMAAADNDGRPYLLRVIELIVHSDPDDPGGSEIDSGYKYQDDYDAAHDKLDDIARQRAETAQAHDPADYRRQLRLPTP
jgi:hypothetical protein